MDELIKILSEKERDLLVGLLTYELEKYKALKDDNFHVLERIVIKTLYWCTKQN